MEPHIPQSMHKECNRDLDEAIRERDEARGIARRLADEWHFARDQYGIHEGASLALAAFDALHWPDPKDP